MPLFLASVELRSEAKEVGGFDSRKFHTIYFHADLWNPPLCPWEKFSLRKEKCIGCVWHCVVGGKEAEMFLPSQPDFRLPVLSLPKSVSSWHQRQKVMLSGFLPFSPALVFSKEFDRWNSTPSAPCPYHNAVHLSKLQTSAIICALFRVKANYLFSERRWQRCQ